VCCGVFKASPPRHCKAQKGTNINQYHSHSNIKMDSFHRYTPQPAPPASSITLSSLQRISGADLKNLLLVNPSDPTLAIIDVRDSDYIGGHILGCINVPSPTLDYRMPELVRTLKDKKTVVFHCALSQQRGPSAALQYLRERERLKLGAEKKEENTVIEGDGSTADVVGQRVFVLDGGFVKWQERYGTDEKLTEGYAKDIWADGGGY